MIHVITKDNCAIGKRLNELILGSVCKEVGDSAPAFDCAGLLLDWGKTIWIIIRSFKIFVELLFPDSTPR